MAKGAPRNHFKLTKWRLEHGIVTRELHIKYLLAQQILKELAEAKKLVDSFGLEPSDKMDWTGPLRKAIEEVRLTSPVVRLKRAGRPVQPANLEVLAA